MPLIKDVAREDAEKLLDEYWGNRRLPVDPAYIALLLDLAVYRADLGDDTSGMLVKEQDGVASIYLNRYESEERQNFTCAHELGHYVERMNSGDQEFSFVDRRGDRWGTNDHREWYAEHFAANLLMPQADFERLWDSGLSIGQLALSFAVSPAAIRTRARGLRLDAPRR